MILVRTRITRDGNVNSKETKNSDLQKRAKRISREIEELKRDNGLKFLHESLAKNTRMALCSNFSSPVISRLQISNSFQICLIDYGIDINMNRTLCKVFYILFLRHPEGIRLKDIADYKDELMFIYKNVSNRVDLNKMEASINSAIDIENRTMLFQYISRANKAFRDMLDDTLSCHYIISSDRTNVSTIRIDRSLVTLPPFLSAAEDME